MQCARRATRLNKEQMPEFVKTFMREAVSLARQTCGDQLLAVYLFGGLARREFSAEASDVDMLFILVDGCPIQKRRRLEQALQSLEIKYGLLRIGKENSLFCVFACKTALFKSHFILSSKSLREMDFKSMITEGKGFDVFPGSFLFSLAPSRLVIRNVLVGSELLYGKDFVSELVLPSPTLLDLNKALLVSLGISAIGIVSSLITKSGTRFSLEGFKWYILNACSFMTCRPSSVRLAQNYLRHYFPRSWVIINRFAQLRRVYSRDMIFSLANPFYILSAHLILFNALRTSARSVRWLEHKSSWTPSTKRP